MLNGWTWSSIFLRSRRYYLMFSYHNHSIAPAEENKLVQYFAVIQNCWEILPLRLSVRTSSFTVILKNLVHCASFSPHRPPPEAPTAPDILMKHCSILSFPIIAPIGGWDKGWPPRRDIGEEWQRVYLLFCWTVASQSFTYTVSVSHNFTSARHTSS